MNLAAWINALPPLPLAVAVAFPVVTLAAIAALHRAGAALERFDRERER